MPASLLLLAAVSVAALPGLALWTRLVDGMIFKPTLGVTEPPEALGIAAESVFFDTEDGVRVHAFFVPAPQADRAILFLHGNAGNASDRLPYGARLAQLGAHVLLLDYRGYGLSRGHPSEAGVFSDARAGLAHLIGRGIPEARIVVFGRSLGSAVAVDLAQDRALGGLVLEAAFPSIEEVARQAFGPVGSFFARGRFRSDRKIDRVRCPLLFLHGDNDQLIDLELGRRLFERAPEPKTFVTIAGAGHNDTALVGGESYFARLGSFLDGVAP